MKSKRYNLARGVLALALLLAIVSQCLPMRELRSSELISANGGKDVVFAQDEWVGMIVAVTWPGWAYTMEQVNAALVLMAWVFLFGMIATAPLLVGVYSRSTPLRWLARMIAGLCGLWVLLEAWMLMDPGIQEAQGPGQWVRAAAVGLLAVGMFLIPGKGGEIQNLKSETKRVVREGDRGS